VLDGLSNTIMIVEGDSGLAVPWMQPQDIDLNQFLNAGTAKNSGGHDWGGHVMMGDGAVVFIADSMSPELREAMISKDGQEIIDHGSVGF
jgi:hypothetical protein